MRIQVVIPSADVTNEADIRTVELREGLIEIDGVNIRDIGLDILRRQLALVPQDSTLFLGTLRENL